MRPCLCPGSRQVPHPAPLKLSAQPSVSPSEDEPQILHGEATVKLHSAPPTICGWLLAFTLALPGAAQAMGQSPQAGAPAPTRVVGSVTAISPSSITVKAESGTETTLTVDAQTRVLRATPGAKSLAGATPISIGDLAAGDRVLVAARPGTGDAMRASTVIAMKSADIAETHAREAQAWQQRGLSGVVRSVTPGAGGTGGTVVLATSGQAGRTVTLQLTPTTVIRRYSATSVNFADAKPATLAEINPGDQMRALPAEGATGGDTVPVEQVVAGSFQNIAGTVVNASSGSIVVTNLATKKPVTLQLTADTQLHRLPPEMAERLARRSQGGAAATGAPGTAPEGGARPAYTGQGGEAPAGGRARGGELSGLLARAPQFSPADLKKGDALMIVATRGAEGAPVAAITVLAGVEPLLQANGGGSASQDVFSASWNLGGSGTGAGAEAPQ